ncbi:MAG: bifunctional DNA-formamidopyrimidine glycosylase/DNA-(apurinic or apyrimidinic site) lyase [Halocynthiibacter sp.]
MPELPEVETVMRGLQPVMEGKRIAKADIRRPDLRWPFPERMQERLTGVTVTRMRRCAKYIVADLSSGESLIIHLGMSGRMLISGESSVAFARERAVPEKHDHVIFDMDGGARVSFNDARRFGAMDLAPTKDVESHKFFAKLGPEPLSNHFHPQGLYDAISTRKTPLKTVLLDQSVVAGLGNIYVCEILYRARLNPVRQAQTVSLKTCEKIVPLVREVLSEAIESGGSTLKDHRSVDGELGYFQHSFAVYGREGETCQTPSCGQEIIRIVQSGRSTFLCPGCQE